MDGATRLTDELGRELKAYGGTDDPRKRTIAGAWDEAAGGGSVKERNEP